MLDNLCYTFPAKHVEFYQEFEKWRTTYKNQGNTIIDGVYELITPVGVPRLMGVDPHGILYIGKATNIVNYSRIGKLINAINRTEHRHDGGTRYSVNIQKKYPIDDMTVNVYMTTDAAALEREKLNAYFNEYGELPPLNRSGA